MPSKSQPEKKMMRILLSIKWLNTAKWWRKKVFLFRSQSMSIFYIQYFFPISPCFPLELVKPLQTLWHRLRRCVFSWGQCWALVVLVTAADWWAEMFSLLQVLSADNRFAPCHCVNVCVSHHPQRQTYRNTNETQRCVTLTDSAGRQIGRAACCLCDSYCTVGCQVTAGCC